MILKDKCEICGGLVSATFIYEKDRWGKNQNVLNDVRCVDCGKAIVYPSLTYEEFIEIEFANRNHKQ